MCKKKKKKKKKKKNYMCKYHLEDGPNIAKISSLRKGIGR